MASSVWPSGCGIWGKRMITKHIPFKVLSSKYDDLYRRGQEILARHNPCQIQQGHDGSVSCYASRKDPNRGMCCGGCQHLTSHGCRVNSLACKLWLCYEVKGTPAGRAAMLELDDLEQKAFENHIPKGFRTSRRANLNPYEKRGLIVICNRLTFS